MLFNFKKTKGFTLIELLVVISIIGILVAVLSVNISGSRQRARDVKRKADLVRIREALQQYFNDKGNYPCPSSDGGVTCSQTSVANCAAGMALLSNQLTGYIDSLPTDPKSPTYDYCYLPRAAASSTSDIIPAFGGFILLANLENNSDKERQYCGGLITGTLPGEYSPAYVVNVDFGQSCTTDEPTAQ